MSYVELNFKNISEKDKDLLSGLLSLWKIEGIEETHDGLKAFFKESELDKNNLKSHLRQINPDWLFEVIKMPDKNWNEEWEKNYNPTYIDNKVLIRAPFHKSDPSVDLEVIIEPKMAFGTGHHPTTSTMIKRMLEIDMKDKKVLDLGSGSGILSIIASKLNAKSVVAIDYDEWAFNNSEENTLVNNCLNITNIQGDLTNADFQKQLITQLNLEAPEKQFDVLLANLNRNLLVEIMPKFSIFAKRGAHILVSGILEKDYPTIRKEFLSMGYSPDSCTSAEGWVVAEFILN